MYTYMIILFNENEYKALLSEVATVLEGDSTTPHSPAPSNAVGKTATIDFRLVDIDATVDEGTGILHRQYIWPEDTCRFSPHLALLDLMQPPTQGCPLPF